MKVLFLDGYSHILTDKNPKAIRNFKNRYQSLKLISALPKLNLSNFKSLQNVKSKGTDILVDIFEDHPLDIYTKNYTIVDQI